MNGRFASLADRLTHRLRMDPDLRRDVAEELESHLEACAAEYVEAGEPRERADDLAGRAMGDEADLADQLWRANRGRIRVRFWARWVARVTILPAVILAVLMFPIVHQMQVRQTMDLFEILEARIALQDDTGPGERQPHWEAAAAEHPLLRGLSERERLLLLGDPAAANPAERWRQVAAAFPENHPVQARYALAIFADAVGLFPGVKTLDADRVDLAVTRLAELAEADPDNALADLLQAALLLNRIDQQIGDAEDRLADDAWLEAIAGSEPLRRDVERARAAIGRAAARAKLTTRTLSYLRESRSLLPPPRSFNEYMLRQTVLAGHAIDYEMPVYASYRYTCRRMIAYARWLAEQDRTQEATALLDELEDINRRYSGHADLLIQLMTGTAIHQEILLAQEELLAERGDEQFASAKRAERERIAAYSEALRDARQGRADVPITGPATALAAMLYEIGGYGRDVNWAVIRDADRTGLALLLLGSIAGSLLLLLLISALAATVQLLLARGDHRRRPRLIRPVGRELATASAAVLALPLLVGGLWLGAAQQHLSITQLIAVSSLGTIVALLALTSLQRRATRRQGHDVPPNARWWRWMTGGSAAVLILATVVWSRPDWHAPLRGELSPLVGALLAAAVSLAWIIAALIRFVQVRRSSRVYAASAIRSSLPTLAVVIAVLGVAGGASILHFEAAVGASLDREARFGVMTEIQAPAAAELQAALRDPDER